jgi:hypothetical protein
VQFLSKRFLKIGHFLTVLTLPLDPQGDRSPEIHNHVCHLPKIPHSKFEKDWKVIYQVHEVRNVQLLADETQWTINANQLQKVT